VLGDGWNSSNNRTRLGLGTTDSPRFAGITFQEGEQSLSNSIVAGQQSIEFKVTNVSKLSIATNSVSFTVPLLFSGTNTAAATRTNLGLGWSALTNTNVSNFCTAIGLGVANDVTFGSVTASSIKELGTGNRVLDLENSALTFGTNYVLEWSATEAQFNRPLRFFGTNTAATTRTNLGLGWSALTNTNTSGFNTSLYGSGTNPVLYSTNGEVVSPTNFWQVAPIVTRFVESQPVANQTTNITAARSLHIHSLAISTTGVTNTIALPTTNSFNGDIALVVHQGPTSSVTAVRTAGAATNLVTLNRPEEAVEFVYYNNVWQFNHNRSFVEPIYFSGTNTASNAAVSRTNLGLGASWLTNTDTTNFRTAIGLGTTNSVTFSALTLSSDLTLGSADNIVLSTTTGTKIGTATNQLLGFYNQTPIAQPSSTGVTTNGFTTGGGGGTTVHANSTFTGGTGTNAYTISDVVAHLKSLGLLAP
jgi:hypothetical protein